MDIKILIDKAYENIEIHVCNHEKNQEVIKIANTISDFFDSCILGTDENGDKVMLRLAKIIRFYAEKQKVMAQDEHGLYRIPQKLYELEKMLDETNFIRISKSEIVNMRKIRKLDMNMVGTIKVILNDGTETYTSRRNVTHLKKKLGLS